MLSIILSTGAYLVFMHELRKACDKIVGDETYEEYLKRMANKEAEKIKRRNTELV